MDNTNKKQTIKKYVVFAGMAVVFCVSMWFIFKPSAEDIEKEKQQTGVNADVPDPHNTGIVDSKIAAYEQELMQQKKEERMRSLQDYSFNLGNNAEDDKNALPALADDSLSVEKETNDENESVYSNRQEVKSPYSYSSSSSSAYSDINKTLDSFYEKKEEDPEKEALMKELEEYKNNQLAVPEIRQPSYEEKLAIMEKSHEMAAKYMGNGNQEQVPVETEKKIQVSSVKQLAHLVVTSLVQPMTNEEFVEQFSKARNMGFYTAEGREQSNNDRNTISAVIHDNQTIISGQTVKVRITEPMVVGNSVVPANTILTGVGRIASERVQIIISSIEHHGSIIPIELSAYDTDGQSGIYVPGSMELNAAKEIVGNMGSSMGSGINISQQGAGDQLLSDLGRSVIQGTSQYVASKAKEVKVTLKAGYRIFLFISEQ